MVNNSALMLKSQMEKSQERIDRQFKQIEDLYRIALADNDKKTCSELMADYRELCEVQAQLNMVKEIYSTYVVA